MNMNHQVSVTSFGKISPLWQSSKSLAIILGFFSFGQNFESILANFSWIWAKFFCSKWTTIDQIILPSDRAPGLLQCPQTASRRLEMSQEDFEDLDLIAHPD